MTASLGTSKCQGCSPKKTRKKKKKEKKAKKRAQKENKENLCLIKQIAGNFIDLKYKQMCFQKDSYTTGRYKTQARHTEITTVTQKMTSVT